MIAIDKPYTELYMLMQSDSDTIQIMMKNILGQIRNYESF